MAATPILDLSTEHERQVVRIDKVDYQMRLGRDLPYNSRQRAMQLALQLRDPLLAMTAGRVLPKAQQRAVERLLREACTMAIPAPPAVLKRLDDVSQIALAMSFLERSAMPLKSLGAMMRASSAEAGSTSLPASPASTAATRSTGRPKSRSGPARTSSR